MILFLAALFAAPAVQTVAVEGEVSSATTADLDGDGRRDLLAFFLDGERKLGIFWGTANLFAKKPDLVVALDELGACGYDVADVDGARGDELLLLTPSGVTSLAYGERRRAEPVALVTTRTLFQQPDREDVPRIRLAQAVLPEGLQLLVPAPGALELYARRDGKWTQFSRLAIDMEAQFDPRARRVVAKSRAAGAGAMGSIALTHIFPALVIADSDGDGRRDVLAALEDRLLVYRQLNGGQFAPNPSTSRDFALRTVSEQKEASSVVGLTIRDIDGDGLADVLARKQVSQGITSATTTTSLYFGQRGGGWSREPAQQLRSEGLGGADAELFDVNGDTRPDLVLPSVSIGVIAVVRMITSSTIKVTFKAFPFEAKARKFADEPAAEREFKFRIDTRGRSDAQILEFEADFSGDGRNDLAFAAGENQLGFYKGDPGEPLFADDPAQSVPVRAWGMLEPADLDGKAGADAVLWYPHTKGRRHEIVVVRNSQPF